MTGFRHLWWAGIILLVILIGAVYTIDILGGDELPSDLASVEVRDFEGSSLSSIYEFRENSIRGPQLVNLSEYRLSISGMVASAQAKSVFAPWRKIPLHSCGEPIQKAGQSTKVTTGILKRSQKR